MRKIIPLNKGWAFTRQADVPPTQMPQTWPLVDLPHTWNALDGQDGGNDYDRGTGYYAKTFPRASLPDACRCYLELQGANATATVYLNGRCLGCHHGGYSTWRVELTPALAAENLLVIAVDNGDSDAVYPQMADFTFYGGLYRAVQLLCVDPTHFTLDDHGGPGLVVTPEVQGDTARVHLEVAVTGWHDDCEVTFRLYDAAGAIAAETTGSARTATLTLDPVHLWQGKADPYCYRAEATLHCGGKCLDQVSLPFGCRTIAVDPERGFLLNGKPYPLRGVSRHQDRWGRGNALLPEHHRQDMDLICELGATSVRLAHYQHDQYFYDLCDRRGLVVWAEIPYISRHSPAARENAAQQLRELIIQSRHHPSIAVWGLSNEITIGGDPGDVYDTHVLLNDLAHRLDPTRLTAVACLSTCPPDAPYAHLPDLVAYNHYFGWYGGEPEQNGPWFDRFHARYPQTPIGCSEYGCEGLDWHASDPVQGDYTEEYQARYHESLILQFFSRPYLWCTYVWNMFDFGADARSEGGENGQNHKGLVTFDRCYKKDAFYAYKAWLSDEPFVHLCGKRYPDRAEAVTRVTVYSNQPAVSLYANGQLLQLQRSETHFFYFDVPNEGETVLIATAGSCRDESRLRRVAEFPEHYRLRENGIVNWFEITAPAGRLSLHDKISRILETPAGRRVLGQLRARIDHAAGPAGFDASDAMTALLPGFTLLRLCSMLGTMGVTVTKDELLALNRQLNEIPQPDAAQEPS